MGRRLIPNAFVPVCNRDAAIGLLWADLNRLYDLGTFQNLSGDGGEEAVLRETREIHGRLIRQLVDEWLSTGFNEDRTVEEPYDRYVWSDEEGSTKCQAFIEQWTAAHPKALAVSKTGELEYVRDFAHERDPRTSEEEASQHAGWQMAMLLNDLSKWAIAKCPKCSAYYFRSRIRKVYKRPTFCSGCRGSATASRRMREKREQDRREALLRAARAFADWSKLSTSTRRRYGDDERTYIAAQVAGFGFTRKWVSRNMTAIEQLGDF